MTDYRLRPSFSGTLVEDLAIKLGITALDIGARRGFCEDLLPLAKAVDAVGFEADADECARLVAAAEREAHPWKRLRFVPHAVGAERGSAQLHIYQRRGCTSLLEADQDLARQFGRDDYYFEVGTATVDLHPLDSIAHDQGIEKPSFLKIDIQGFELEAFKGATRLLSESLSAVRAEVSFLPIYRDQPLFGDICGYLGQFGFFPVEFIEIHHWRRLTRRKYGRFAPGPVSASRGELVHGDVLFLKSEDRLGDDGDACIRLALIAACYGLIDLTHVLLTRPAVLLAERYGIDPKTLTSEAARAFRTIAKREQFGALARSSSQFVSNLLT